MVVVILVATLVKAMVVVAVGFCQFFGYDQSQALGFSEYEFRLDGGEWEGGKRLCGGDKDVGFRREDGFEGAEEGREVGLAYGHVYDVCDMST